jgi:uncharacterized membrane protein
LVGRGNNTHDGRKVSGGRISTGRVEAFSDGVIAVAITLLVLDIKLPHGLRSNAELWHGVASISHALLAWIVSFTFVLTFWVHHHYFFSSLKCSDRGLLWLNGLFLMAIAILPFPLGLMSEYPGFGAPVVLLCGAMLFACLSFSGLRLYATFRAKLLHDGVTAKQEREAMRRNLIAPALCSISFILSFSMPAVAIATQGILLVVFFFCYPSLHALECPDEIAQMNDAGSP